MDTTQILSVAGVLAVLLAGILYANLAPRLRKARSAGARAAAADAWVGRHVHGGGEVLGEVVAEEEGRLLVRRPGGQVLSVARSDVRPEAGDLVLRPGFDRQAAVAAGEAWQAGKGAM